MGEKEIREWLSRIEERLDALRKAFDRHCETQVSMNQALLVLFIQATVFFCIGKFF